MERLKAAPSYVEVDNAASYFERRSEEEAKQTLQNLGERAMVKTAFEQLSETEEAVATNETAQRIMNGPTTYTMPEGDPNFLDV